MRFFCSPLSSARGRGRGWGPRSMLVYIVATYPTIRAGLAALVRSQPDWSVVGEAAPATLLAETRGETGAATAVQPAHGGNERQESLPESRQDAIDVVLADLDGLADSEMIASWLSQLAPRGGLVVISAAGPNGRRGPAQEERLPTRLLDVVIRATEEYGLAFGALPRDATRDELIAALTAVGNGLVALDRRLADSLLSARERATLAVPERLPNVSGIPGVANAGETLTARELEVLQLLAQGLPNKLIAARLHITEHTAKFHVSSILLKLGAASRTEAVTLAARRGLLLL